MFCLFVEKVCFKLLLAKFEHNIVWKLLELFHYTYSYLLTVVWTHVTDVYLTNQMSNKISLWVYVSVLQTYSSCETLVIGLGPGET